ncbi:hypothetical protein KY284_014130 [Solanum tuberosum]|nr:hypothetical protein KY284_014130 [Solanum tuberosum]
MWAENRSKHLHDPLAMKDKSVVKPKTKVGETSKKGRRKAASVIFRPTLSKSQITKCMLLLEVQHENKDLLHVRHANGTVLQFSIKDFAIVTGLKCKGNVKDFSYPKFTTSRLLQRYFPDATADEVEALDLPDIQDAHTPGPSTTTVDVKKVQTKDSSGFEDFSTSPHGHLFRRSSCVSGTSSPPPPKRRKKIDTSKTKLSEPKSSEQLRPLINQSFSMPDETPNPTANVSFVHVSSQGQKDKSVYPDIEELKQHMKDYVDNKFGYLVTLIKSNHTELMNSRHREDDHKG